MIPYEELCSALARWREKKGLANGPSAQMPQGPILLTPPPAVHADTGEATLAGFGEGAATDEHHVEPVTTITAPPAYDPIAEVIDEEEGDAPTGLHVAPPVVQREITNELQLDDVIDEDEKP